MRFVELLWAFFCTFLVPKSGQRKVVCGMPIVDRGGSGNCSLTILPLPPEASVSFVLFRVVYNAETSFSANSSDCKVVFTSGPENRTRRIALQGIFQRDVVLSRGKQLRSLIMLSKEKNIERWFQSQFDSVIWISCSDRKFSCAGFPPNGYDVELHVSAIRRKLLSAEQLTADQDGPIRNPLKLVLLSMVGFLILGIAAGMCANCNKDDPASQSPHLVAMEIRQSERKLREEEKPVQVDVTRHSNDAVFVEGGDKRRENSLEVAAFTADEEVAARSQSMKEEDPRQESGAGLAGGDIRRSETDETEHEEHRAGKFWKRSRNSKNRGSPSFSHSDTVFREEEHKDRRSRKPDKVKVNESENTERKLSQDSKEQVECHSRELPPPPGEHSAPALPVRPIPSRQFSVPDGSAEENYEEVEVRRTKSVDSPYILADDLYDAVRNEGVNVRPSSASYEVIGSARNRDASDIYDVVDEPMVDDLYWTVADTEKEDRELEMRTNDIGSLGNDSYEGVQQEDEEAENPYSKVNTSSAELYEEVDKAKGNDKLRAVETKTDVHGVLVVEVNSARARTQSEGAKLQRNAVDEEAKRPHTIHVMQSPTEESHTPFDYLYAKVDLSKKLKNRSAAEGGSSQAQTIGEEWEATSELPPPLPPPYVSTKQMKIEMGWTEEPSGVVVENLYDEVNPRQPISQLLTKNDEYSRVNNEFVDSAQYDSVETSVVAHGLNGDVQHDVDDEDEPRYELVTPRAAPVSKNLTPRKQSFTDPIWL